MCTRDWMNAIIHIQRSIDTKSLFVNTPGSSHIYFWMVTINLYYSFLYGVYCINFPLHRNIYKIFASVSIKGDMIVLHESWRTMQTDLFRVWPISVLIELRRYLNRLALIKIEEQCKLIYLKSRWPGKMAEFFLLCVLRDLNNSIKTIDHHGTNFFLIYLIVTILYCVLLEYGCVAYLWSMNKKVKLASGFNHIGYIRAVFWVK